jgi:glycosyltransferase involved in cell wall biosynthesis
MATPSVPCVDVNLIVYNSELTIGATMESVLAQTWPAVSVTVMDNGSDDRTLDIVAGYVASHPSIRVRRNRCNVGPIANIQRAFWFGDADFVMPKTGDDVVAQDYIEQLMGVLLQYPDCAMCHAAGLVVSDAGQVETRYPDEHLLTATGPDPVARARHVMQHYTTAPSFWGVYRRDAVDRLSTIRYRSGFDHAVLAELALYGEIRHVPSPLFWRRGGGKPVMHLARGATEQGNRGVSLDDVLGDPRWLTPLITTAYTHVEAFVAARLPLAQRRQLVEMVPDIFRARWLSPMRCEAELLRAALPRLLHEIASAVPAEASWLARSVLDVLLAVRTILPEEDFSLALMEIAALTGSDAH